MSTNLNNLFYDCLDSDTINKLLTEKFDWKPNRIIYEIFPYEGKDNRISEFAKITKAENEPLHSKIKDCFETANNFYNYNLDGNISIKIQRYNTAGYMDWHVDEKVENGVGSFGSSNIRMLTMSLLLNENFEGGKMSIRNPEESITTEYAGPIGNAVVFPSTWLHKVDPINNGIRYVLTAWAYGDI